MDMELITRLAWQARIIESEQPPPPHRRVALSKYRGEVSRISRLASRVAEECAKICDAHAERDDNAAADIAMAIRDLFRHEGAQP